MQNCASALWGAGEKPSPARMSVCHRCPKGADGALRRHIKEWIPPCEFQHGLPYLLSGISVGGQYALIAIGYDGLWHLASSTFAHGDVVL